DTRRGQGGDLAGLEVLHDPLDILVGVVDEARGRWWRSIGAIPPELDRPLGMVLGVGPDHRLAERDRIGGPVDDVLDAVGFAAPKGEDPRSVEYGVPRRPLIADRRAQGGEVVVESAAPLVTRWDRGG